MKTTRNAIAVGIVTVLMAVGLYFALRFVSETSETEGEYKVWAMFPDASGLVEKSQIRIAGIPVGHIEQIQLEEYSMTVDVGDGGATARENRVGARVDMIIDGDVVLYRNAKALRSASGLLGNQFLVLVPGDATEPKLKDGDQIEQVGDAGLMGNIDRITTDIREVTRNMRSVFGSQRGEQQMAEMLQNLKEITASMNEILKANAENVNRTIENIDGIAAEARPGVREIIKDIKAITTEMRHFVEVNTGKAGSAVNDADSAIREIRSAVSKLDRTLDNLADVTDGVREGEGTVGRLLRDDKLIDDVEEVVEEASGFIKGITGLKTIVGLSGEYNFYRNTMKTGLQLRLQPREDKYYMVEAVYDPRGSTIKREEIRESTNPEDPAQYKEVRYITKDSLLFSFMFARRLWFATFRFGIKESSGGLGFDVHLFGDRVELSTDLYRFGSDVYPRLKELVAIEFLKNMYIIGGVNDILNDSRDYFIGAMLRFDDQDLKTILPFTPTP